MEAPPIPAHPTLASLRAAASNCRACDLWRGATQVVFGEGSEDARAIVVGEQPGDREDVSGHPFVGPAGPAGRILDQALEAAGIDRGEVYVTNAVKPFKSSTRTGGSLPTLSRWSGPPPRRRLG